MTFIALKRQDLEWCSSYISLVHSRLSLLQACKRSHSPYKNIIKHSRFEREREKRSHWVNASEVATADRNCKGGYQPKYAPSRSLCTSL